MQGKNGQYADTVFLNGVVYTVSLAGQEDIFQAVGIHDGKILFCGSDEEALGFIGPDTKVHNLDGKMILPGFCDAHNHNQAMVSALFALDLSPYASIREYQSAIATWRVTHPNCTYITGNGWSLPHLGNVPPRKEDLDVVCSDIPLAFFDTTHHVLWTNSLAIENSGVKAGDKNPPGGVIDMDPNTGEPTGIFSEDAAIGLIMAKFPDFEVEQYEIALCAYQEMANSFGITMAQDCMLMPGSNAIEAYQQLALENRLTMRARGTYTASPAVAGSEYKSHDEAEKELSDFIHYCALRRDQDHTGELFQVNTIKLFEDGGGPTTYVKEPYEGSEDVGETVWPDNQLAVICEKARNAGFQIHVHAMGDGAIAKTLDAFDFAEQQVGEGNRDVITHLMLVDEPDIKRMAKQGVVGVVQPYWMCRDEYYSRMYFPLLGEERTNRFYPMKSLVDAGMVVASSSDWPVTIPNMPLHAIQTGITRQIPYDNPAIPIPNLAKNPEYRYPLGPSDNPLKECVDFKTMVQSFTINGAFSLFAETVTGSIEPGKSADLVVIDKNLLQVPANEISLANVIMTVFRGETVYQANQDFLTGHDAGVDNDAGARGNDEECPQGDRKEKNSYTIVSMDQSGCRVEFAKPVSNLRTQDIYLLNMKNKVSAETVSATPSNGGLIYDIVAFDWIGRNGLEAETEYGVYVYDEKYEFTNLPQVAQTNWKGGEE